MKLTTIITLAVVGTVAATVGAGTAVAADQDLLPPVLTDNTTLIPNSVDPLGAPTYQFGSNTYSVTVANPNSDGVLCGVGVVSTDLAAMTPVQVFPNKADWDINASSWSTFPDAVPAGQSRTFTVDTSGVSFNEFMVYAGCGTDTVNGPVMLRHLYRMTGLPGLPDFGSSGFGS